MNCSTVSYKSSCSLVQKEWELFQFLVNVGLQENVYKNIIYFIVALKY